MAWHRACGESSVVASRPGAHLGDRAGESRLEDPVADRLLRPCESGFSDEETGTARQAESGRLRYRGTNSWTLRRSPRKPDVVEDGFDDRRLQNGGNDLQFVAAVRVPLAIDLELEPRPAPLRGPRRVVEGKAKTLSTARSRKEKGMCFLQREVFNVVVEDRQVTGASSSCTDEGRGPARVKAALQPAKIHDAIIPRFRGTASNAPVMTMRHAPAPSSRAARAARLEISAWLKSEAARRPSGLCGA